LKGRRSSIQSFVKKLKYPPPLNILNYMKKFNMEDLSPNIWVSLRILLTIPVSAVSGDRSFSKLKLFKAYLRSFVSQKRLSSQATLSIENTIAQNFGFSELIKNLCRCQREKSQLSLKHFVNTCIF
jgi:hypothetical protein